MQLFDDLEDFGEFDDFVSGDVRDPYTELNRLRREEPIQKIEIPGIPGEEGKPIFMVYRYEEAQQMLRDNETFSSSIIIQAFGDVFGKHVMLGMDEPAHGRHRALVSKAFSQKALARWEDELVTKVGNALIDRFAARGSADLVKEFNFPYPTLIIAGLLGLPQEDYAQFQKWSISLLSFTVNPERGREASQALAKYFGPILDARRQEPRDDLISGLAAAEIDGEKLSDEEIFSFLRLLLPAGVETTYRSLGNLLFGLLSNPDQLDAVRADRSLLPQAIEEAVRWEPPLIMITRVASRDTELGGVHIPAGCSVMPILGAANRQDERYADPNEFNIFRDVKPNIGWGHGVHVCLGMHLARLEMRVALNLLFDRLPNLRLDPAAGDPYIRGQAFRSPTSVPVLFDVPAVAGRVDAKHHEKGSLGHFCVPQLARGPSSRTRLKERVVTDFETVDFFTDASLVPDPYPYFDHLRSKCPVAQATPFNVLAVTGYDEALAVYKDPAFSSCVSVAGPFSGMPFGPGDDDDVTELIEKHRAQVPMAEHITSQDPPLHTRTRSLMNKLITPKRLKENEEFMWRLADQQLDTFIHSGKAEFLTDYAKPFSLLVIADLLGVPAEDYEEFKAAFALETVGELGKETPTSHNPLQWLNDKFYSYIEDRRREPRDDVLTELAQAKHEDGSTPEIEDVMNLSTFLFAAGTETTTKLVSSAVRIIGDNPKYEAVLREDRSKIPAFLEETLRMESPVKAHFRMARTSTTVGEVKIPAGTTVMLLPGACNRDERKFDDPNAFRPERPNVREQIAFIRGAHSCPGAPLARAEGRISLNRILDRMNDITISEEHHGPAEARRYDYESTFIMRGLSELHITFTPVP